MRSEKRSLITVRQFHEVKQRGQAARLRNKALTTRHSTEPRLFKERSYNRSLQVHQSPEVEPRDDLQECKATLDWMAN